jgi:hypothetical protein
MFSIACKLHKHLVCLCVVLLTYSVNLFAQVPTGTLRGQVTDPSGAVISGAKIFAKSPAGKTTVAETGNAGAYELKGLPSGNYTIEVSAKGFAVFTRNVEIVSGQHQTLDVALAIAVRPQQIVVEGKGNGTENPTVDVNPADGAGGIVVQGKDLEALSDDPDDLQAELGALAGPAVGPNGGQIYVDGFTSSQLPPKLSIREVRVNQNPFSADKDKIGYGRIEVITKPGSGQFHGQFRYDNNTSAFNTPDPFLTTVPSYQSNLFGGSVSGPLNKKSSFFFTAERRNISDVAAVNAVILDSGFNKVSVSEALPNPRTLTIINPRVDYQLTSNNMLSVRYQFTGSKEKNGGILQLDLASQAENFNSTTHELQVGDTHAFSASAETETRFQYRRNFNAQTVLSLLPEISVTGAFTGGGNNAGNGSATIDNYELQNNTSVAHGSHVVKFGGRLRVEADSSITRQDFNGTYTFDSLQAFLVTTQGLQQGLTPAQIRASGGGASQFSVIVGQPLTAAKFFDVGLYGQDDWRIRPSMTLSYGLRYEAQNVLHNRAGFAPRLTYSWGLDGRKDRAPNTILRVGFGLFYEPLPPGIALQAERLNGVNQHQFIVQSPDFFPNVLSASALPGAQTFPTIYQINPAVRAPYTAQTGIGLERQLWKFGTLSVAYLNSRGIHQFFSSNINAPLPGTFNTLDPTSGVRPFGNVGNIYQVESEGIFKQNQLITTFNLRVGAKLSLFGNYALSFANSNTTGAAGFLSNQFDAKADYGRAVFDIRHRFYLGGSLSLPYAFRISPFLVANSGRPFNIVTGQDLNGDSLFNDRPAFATNLSNPKNVVITRFGAFDTAPVSGETIIPSHLGAGPAQFTLNLRVTKTFAIGSNGKIGSGSSNGAAPGRGSGKLEGPPYHLTIGVAVRNIFNYENLGSPVGDLSSPLFGQSTQLAGSPFSSPAANRRIDLQAQFSF